MYSIDTVGIGYREYVKNSQRIEDSYVEIFLGAR